ncbi:hypothetical protein BH09MYX1_BH09MYX1_63690 [soil metagenome]
MVPVTYRHSLPPLRFSGDDERVGRHDNDRTVKLHGIRGRPFVDMTPFIELDDARAAELDDEVTVGLASVETSYTGGSLQWMGVTAPWVRDAGYVDYMDVIPNLPRAEFVRFVALGPNPEAFDPDKRADYTFGDETDHPLTLAQMRWLKYRHRVYFPWRCYHLLENDRWEDKRSGDGKSFSDEARRVFPKTVALIEELPFVEMGRVVVFGIEPNDHAPDHRDSEPGRALSIAHSMTLDFRGDKGLTLTDPSRSERVRIDTRAYWFNDMDYHGVDPAPFFRYSIRIDGTYEPDFLEKALRVRAPNATSR